MLYFHRKRGSQEKPHRWKTHIGKGKVGVKMNSLFRQGCRDSWANRPGLPGVSFEFMSMSLHSDQHSTVGESTGSVSDGRRGRNEAVALSKRLNPSCPEGGSPFK